MELPKGITGFREADSTELPCVDKTELKSLAYTVDALDGFKLEEFIGLKIALNYYQLKIRNQVSDELHCVLVNYYFPYYCGVTEDSSWMNLRFKDLPPTIREVFDLKFEYLSPEELNKKAEPKDLRNLSNIEIEQINYWDSKTIGQIMFNGYD